VDFCYGLIHLSYSENISSTFWTWAFYSRTSILEFSFFGIFDFPFSSAFYAICFNHSSKCRTWWYL